MRDTLNKFKDLKDHLKRLLPHKETETYKKIAFWAASIIIGLTLLGMITMAGIIAVLSIGLPDVTDLENLTAAQSTQIYDREGNLLYTIHGEENREHVEYDKIAQYLKDATVAIEDDQFWTHKGFDLWAIGRGLLHEAFGIGTPRGGSTITQQYVKNTFLSSEHSYIRKAKELILSIRLERAYDKEEILGLYLNRIPYGNNAYGCEMASIIYFDKHCRDLSLGESATLAALPQAPSRYNPFGDNKYSHLLKEFAPDEASEIESEYDLDTDEFVRGLIGQHIDLGNGNNVYIQGRSDFVLKRMNELGYITDEERQAALDEIQTLEFNQYRESIKHPHFVLYIKQILEDKYGKDIVERGGLKVYTTIDPELQEYAEQVAEEKGPSNQERFETNNLAILSINPQTGEILAMVGSRDYWNEDIDGNVNIVLRPRQPGSSFKPFVYAQTFYNGYAPGNVIYDVPTRLGADRPQNYDGKWQGQISIRQALGQSRNIPAIKAYFLAGEQDAIIDLVTQMGITTLDKKHSYGYPLALGAGEVPLIEMVQGFSVFATNGKKPEITGIIKVENANGDILEEWQPEEFEEVMDPQIAYLINNILSDQDYGVGPRLFINGKVNAAKTGTSTKESKKGGTTSVRPSDAWTIGYTPSVVTGVWCGNTDGSGLGYNANGYDTASPIFNAVMTKALEGRASEPFPEPEGIKKVKVSKVSGKLPGPNTPASMIVEEIFPSFSVPTEQDDSFFTVKIDRISGLLATEYTPEDAIEEVTFQNYEPIADMLNWAQEVKTYYSGKMDENLDEIRIGLPPTEYDNIHTAETAAKAPSIAITSPSSHVSLPRGIFDIEVSLSAPNGIEKVEFYFDDGKEYFTVTPPYVGHLNISKFLKEGSTHLVVAKIIDSLGYSSQSAIEIKVDSNSEITDGENENPPSDSEPESPTNPDDRTSAVTASSIPSNPSIKTD